MTGLWKKWMIVWCLSVGGFGALITLGAIEATSAPRLQLLAFLGGDKELVMTPHLRFSLAVMGPVTLGWSLALLGAASLAERLPHDDGRTLEWWLTAGVLVWVITDCILSYTTGFAANILPNTLYLIAFAIPVLGSGCLKKNPK